jgi:hypothetical protein
VALSASPLFPRGHALLIVHLFCFRALCITAQRKPHRVGCSLELQTPIEKLFDCCPPDIGQSLDPPKVTPRRIVKRA